jgi:transcriptional regulator of acetoin/glycerol metabolism
MKALSTKVRAYERNMIIEALAANNHNVIRTARALGCNRTDFYKRLERHKIKLAPTKYGNEGNAAWRALEDDE